MKNTTQSFQNIIKDESNTDIEILDESSTPELYEIDSQDVSSEFTFESGRTYSKIDIEKNRHITELSFYKESKSGSHRKAFKAIQKWKGTVIEIDQDSFEARLEDLTLGGNDELEKFYFNDITADERDQLEIGKTFYWTIGQTEYIDTKKIERTSRIVFQRTLSWDIELLDSVKIAVEKYWIFDEE